MMFFTRQINHFMAVARCGSLTNAAELIAITPSALGRSLSELESVLGKTLLRRTRRGIALTETGEYLLQELQPYYDKINHLASHLKEVPSSPAVITVGMDGVFYPAMKDRLTGLITRYPEIKFSVAPTQGGPAEALLQTGELDFVISTLPAGVIAPTSGLSQVALRMEHIGLVVADGLYRQQPEIRELLRTVSLVQKFTTLQHPAFQLLEKALTNKAYDYHVMGVNDSTEVCLLVSEGHGVSLMAEEMLHHPLLSRKPVRWFPRPFAFPLSLQRYLYFRHNRFDELIDMAMLLKGDRCA